MRSLKLFFILALTYSALFAISPLDEKRIVLDKISKETYKLKVFFNYENPYETERLLTGTIAGFDLTVPKADKYEILKATISVNYTSSIVLDPDRSVLSISFNSKVVGQKMLNKRKFLDVGANRVQSDIPVELFDEYNQLNIKITQHYSSQEKESDPELWSQLDLQNSYVEFVFKHKEMPEKISSIFKHFFDNKSIVKEKINFVFPKFPTEEVFTDYGFMAGAIGNILGFRDIDFAVSTKVSNYKNNVLVMLKKDVDATLEAYATENCPDQLEALKGKVAGNINVIQNPINKDKGLLIITGETEADLKKGLYRLIDSDLKLFEEQNVKVFDVKFPSESEPFTAPKFLKAGQKVQFSELGFNTQTFANSKSSFNLNFKVYPNAVFTNEKINAKFNYVYPNFTGSVANIRLNDKFAHQMSLTDQQFQQLSASLLRKGNNNLAVDFYFAPGKTGTNFAMISAPAGGNSGTLALTMMDNSYLVLPKGSNFVKMPEMKYVSEIAFPYSVYPDLQKTGVLITDFDSRSITSAMYVAFFLGKTVGYPPYRLKVTANINNIRDRDIILVGAYNSKYQILYNDAPIKITDEGTVRQYVLGSDFENVETTESKKARLEKHKQIVKVLESGTNENYLVTQMFKSPFDEDRTILSITANDAGTLLNGVENGFVPKHLGAFNGDLWLYNTEKDRSYSFQVREQYLLENLEVEAHEFE